MQAWFLPRFSDNSTNTGENLSSQLWNWKTSGCVRIWTHFHFSLNQRYGAWKTQVYTEALFEQ